MLYFNITLSKLTINLYSSFMSIFLSLNPVSIFPCLYPLSVCLFLNSLSVTVTMSSVYLFVLKSESLLTSHSSNAPLAPVPPLSCDGLKRAARSLEGASDLSLLSWELLQVSDILQLSSIAISKK